MNGTRFERETYLNTEQAALYTGRSTRDAFIKWCRGNGIRLRRPPGARTLVVKKSDVDFALRIR